GTDPGIPAMALQERTDLTNEEALKAQGLADDDDGEPLDLEDLLPDSGKHDMNALAQKEFGANGAKAARTTLPVAQIGPADSTAPAPKVEARVAPRPVRPKRDYETILTNTPPKSRGPKMLVGLAAAAVVLAIAGTAGYIVTHRPAELMLTTQPSDGLQI